jgi:hypothetical protein
VCCPGCSLPVSKTLHMTLPNGHTITMGWVAGGTTGGSWGGSDFYNGATPCNFAGDPVGTTFGWSWQGLSDSYYQPNPVSLSWTAPSISSGGPQSCACPDNAQPTSPCHAPTGQSGAALGIWNGGAQSCPTLAGGILTDSGVMNSNSQYVGNWSITE